MISIPNAEQGLPRFLEEARDQASRLVNPERWLRERLGIPVVIDETGSENEIQFRSILPNGKLRIDRIVNVDRAV